MRLGDRMRFAWWRWCRGFNAITSTTVISVLIDATTFARVRDEPDFQTGVQLLRIASRVRSYQRLYLRVPADGKLASIHDRFEVQLLLCAALFEALQAFSGLMTVIRTLPAFASLKDRIERFNRIYNSRFMGTLAKLRKGALFHFDRKYNSEMLRAFDVTEPFAIVEGESDRNADVVYPIANDTLLTALAKELRANVDDPYQALEDFHSKVLSTADELVRIGHAIALDVLQPWVRKTRRRRLSRAGKFSRKAT